MGKGKSPRTEFTEMALPSASVRREGLPDPAKLLSAGILTKEALDWMEMKTPAAPAPERHIDNAEIRRDAQEAAEEQHRETIRALRRALAERPEKARTDFGIARDYRGPERER